MLRLLVNSLEPIWQVVKMRCFIQVDKHIAARRKGVCAMLGLGNCDAKQMLKQLNMYSFTEADLMEALVQVNDALKTTTNNH